MPRRFLQRPNPSIIVVHLTGANHGTTYRFHQRAPDGISALRGLVKMRASPINGCAYCLDMHSKGARPPAATGRPRRRRPERQRMEPVSRGHRACGVPAAIQFSGSHR
ncbi:MAG TPA: carboxymuconolactone decarboxylase family protein [Burkholderiales bacterium]|nr:carboxymuconolactone decarboxylase family protein [Burkholderiales bacterium]